MKIGFQGKASDARVVEELLSPWDVSFTSPKQADIIIVYDCEEAIVNKAIIVPHDRSDFIDLLRKQKLKLECSYDRPIQAFVSRKAALTVWPERLYDYEGPTVSGGEENSSAELVLNDELSLLKVDVVKEYKRIVNSMLDAKSSALYRLLTSLPIRYDIAPKKIRDLVMRGKRGEKTFNYCDKLPLDALRFMVSRAVERLSGKRLSWRTWRGKNSCCIVTHDVETKQGLARARSVKRLEERYDVESAWYVPTKHFSLDSETIKHLANHGEVGVHGAQHSGNLIRLSSQKLLLLFREARLSLERTIGSAVRGFRSPLLQHSSDIVNALKKAGYDYDTSFPTWEPKHPQTMEPCGIGTVFPLSFSGLLEIPVSVVQDHQLLSVMGLRPREVINLWLSVFDTIKELRGCCVFLSHPEYELLDMNSISEYEVLLNSIASDHDAWVTTPSLLADEGRTRLC